MKIPNSRTISPQFVLFFGIFAVSLSSIFIRLAQNEASSLVVAMYRMVISALVLIPIALPSKKDELRSMKTGEVGLAILSGILLAVHFYTWISSLEYTSITSSVVLVNTSPLWLAILAHIFLEEKIRRYTFVGLMLALAGGTVVAISDTCLQSLSGVNCLSFAQFFSGRAFLGNLLALIGAWTGAGYYLIGRRLRPHLSLTSYIFLVYGVAGAALLISVIFVGDPIFAFSSETYLWLILLALVPQLLGHSSFNYALGHLPAAYISLPLLGEPLISALLAFFILGEQPGTLKIFGAILILVGIAVGIRPERSENAAKV